MKERPVPRVTGWPGGLGRGRDLSTSVVVVVDRARARCHGLPRHPQGRRGGRRRPVPVAGRRHAVVIGRGPAAGRRARPDPPPDVPVRDEDGPARRLARPADDRVLAQSPVLARDGVHPRPTAPAGVRHVLRPVHRLQVVAPVVQGARALRQGEGRPGVRLRALPSHPDAERPDARCRDLCTVEAVRRRGRRAEGPVQVEGRPGERPVRLQAHRAHAGRHTPADRRQGRPRHHVVHEVAPAPEHCRHRPQAPVRPPARRHETVDRGVPGRGRARPEPGGAGEHAERHHPAEAGVLQRDAALDGPLGADAERGRLVRLLPRRRDQGAAREPPAAQDHLGGQRRRHHRLLGRRHDRRGAGPRDRPRARQPGPVPAHYRRRLPQAVPPAEHGRRVRRAHAGPVPARQHWRHHVRRGVRAIRPRHQHCRGARQLVQGGAAPAELPDVARRRPVERRRRQLGHPLLLRVGRVADEGQPDGEDRAVLHAGRALVGRELPLRPAHEAPRRAVQRQHVHRVAGEPARDPVRRPQGVARPVDRRRPRPPVHLPGRAAAPHDHAAVPERHAGPARVRQADDHPGGVRADVHGRHHDPARLPPLRLPVPAVEPDAGAPAGLHAPYRGADLAEACRGQARLRDRVRARRLRALHAGRHPDEQRGAVRARRRHPGQPSELVGARPVRAGHRRAGPGRRRCHPDVVVGPFGVVRRVRHAGQRFCRSPSAGQVGVGGDAGGGAPARRPGARRARLPPPESRPVRPGHPCRRPGPAGQPRCERGRLRFVHPLNEGPHTLPL